MSFFNITYPHSVKNYDGTFFYDIPAKEPCTKRKRLDKKSGTVDFEGRAPDSSLEVTQMLFEAKVQVLMAYMNEYDAPILSEKLSDNDAAFLADIFMNPDYRKYQEIIQEARKNLPGCIDCQLSERIYTVVSQRMSTIKPS